MSGQAQTLLEVCMTGTVAEVAKQVEIQSKRGQENNQNQPAALLKSAIEGNNLPVLQYLINSFKNDHPPPWKSDYTVVMATGDTGRLECFKLFYEADPSVTTTYLGHTGNIAGLAILGENIPLLKFLLGTGLDPNTAELMHKPAVLRAVEFSVPNSVKQYIAKHPK